ncbi:MAG: pyruvate formate lyase-activating protein [Clostridia bacterium]|nr:pyruvate formate lyase-activating protein [Clostridia bacterium]
MSTKGRIHSFQSMGAVDGPGLRCVVFMQGCPLRCVYCHNPDTHSFNDGEEYTPEEMLQKILRFKSYIKNGGVTVSGGEPLSQTQFVKELFTLLRENEIHTALDTAGIGDLNEAKELLEVTDLVLLDIKFLTKDDYHKHCGGDLDKVIEFLHLTQEMDIPLWIRQVIVPDLNDGEENITALLEFLQNCKNIKKIELLPFRKLCMPKYENLGISFPLADTPEMSQAGIDELYKLIPENLK